MRNINDFDSDESNGKFRIEHYPAFKLLIVFCGFLVLFAFVSINVYIVLFLALIFLISLVTKIPNWMGYFCGIAVLAAIISMRLDNVEIKVKPRVVPEMPAVFIGKVEAIIKNTPKSIRIKARGSLDTKYLPEIEYTGVIIDFYKTDNKADRISIGNTIYTTVKARLPRQKLFPTDFDEKFYAKYNNVQWYAAARTNNISIINDSKNIRAVAAEISESLAHRIDKLFAPEFAGIVKAMLIGDKSDLNNETKQIFSLTGTAHVLAVSGLHVAIISGIIILFVGAVENRIIKFIIFSVAMMAYAFITGLSPSVLRAGIMAVTVYFVYAMDRNPKSLNLISVAVIAMIIADPTIIYAPAFQMSAASVYGIIILYPIVKRSLTTLLNVKSIVGEYIINSLAVTFAASAMVSPIVAYYFEVFSIVSPLANLFVIPLMSLAMLFAIVALALSFVSIPLGVAYAGSANLIIDAVLYINKMAVAIPYSYLGQDGVLIISIIISLIMIYVFASDSRPKLAFRMLSSAIITALLMIILNSEQLHNQTPKIYPMQGVVVAEIPLSNNRNFIYIADRRNKQYPKAEYSLQKYLINSDKDLIIAVTGNIGMATLDKIKRLKPINAMELTFNQQKALVKKLNINSNFHQII